MNKSQNLKQLFSLVELLVIISILAILASLMTAGLRKMVAKSNTVSCVNNLKQVNHSAYLYQDDFGGSMVYQYSRSVESNRTYFWSQMIMHLGYYGVEFNNKNFEKVYNCPERETAPRRDRTPWGYNLRIANWWSSNPDKSFFTVNYNDIKNPTDTFLFVESLVKGGTEDWGFFMINKGWYPNFHGFNPLHMQYGNVAFADGRVESIFELDYIDLVAQPNHQNPWFP